MPKLFLPTTYRPYFECLLGFLCFYQAVQRERGPIRYLFGIMHIFSMVCCVQATVLEPSYQRQVLVPFAIASTMHTASLIFIDGVVITADATTSLLQRVRGVFRVWGNLRRLRLVEHTPISDRVTERTVIRFTMYRLGHLLMLSCLNQMAWLALKAVELINYIITLSLQDSDPKIQGLLPADTENWQRPMLRLGICFEWVWTTYIILANAHDLCAIFHVAVIGSDYPSEWPPLFGPFYEAYSIRRFWGVFWPRLHVPTFEAWMPSCHGHAYLSRLCCCSLCCSLDGQAQEQTKCIRGPSGGGKQIKKALRALWVFLMSAAYYSLVNGVVLGWDNTQLFENIRFFLINWALCMGEAVVSKEVYRRLPKVTPSLFLTAVTRLLGFTWVLFVFFYLVPDWRYPPLVAATQELMTKT